MKIRIRTRYRKNKFISSIVLALILLLAYSPLIDAVIVGSIPNQRSYWDLYDIFPGNYASSYGHLKKVNESVVVGDTKYENNSWAAWKFNVYLLPSLSERAKKATKAYFIIEGHAPVSEIQPVIKPSQIGWQDDSFKEGWEFNPGGNHLLNSSYSTNGGILILSGNFTSGIRGYMVFGQRNLSIDTETYPYFFIRFKSTTQATRVTFGLKEGGGWNILHDSYASNWTVRIQRLGAGETVNSISLLLDSADYPGTPGIDNSLNVSGMQYAYFDYIIFAGSLESEGSHARISLGEDLIFDEVLNFETNGGLYTLDPAKYGPTIEIPFDLGLLKEETLVNISVDGYTSWNISSIKVKLVTHFADVSEPAWQTSSPVMVIVIVAFPSSLIAGLVMLNKLRKWITAS